MKEIDFCLEKLVEYYSVSSQEQLAIKIGVTPQTISTWKARNSISAIKKRCRELGIYKEIFGETTVFSNANNTNAVSQVNQGGIGIQTSTVTSKSELCLEFEKIETLANLCNQGEFLKNELEKIKKEIVKYL